MPWELTGNPGIDPATDFLGTTDGQPLVIKTNALERMRITPDGQAWFKGMLRIDSGHITTNVPDGALVLNAGPPDATPGAINVAGIWFRKTTVLGDPTVYTDLMRVTPDGNVGIGTIWPQKPLDVTASGGIRISQSGNASSNNELYFQDNGQIRSLDDNHRIIFDRANNILELREYGDLVFSSGATSGTRTQTVTFKANGNVGIGTPTPGPGAKLTVAGSVSVTALGTYSNIEFTGHPIEISTGYSSDDFNLFMGADRANQLSYIQSGHHNIGKATLALNPQGGNVDIGTKTTSAKLTVNGDISVTGDVILTGGHADCAEEFDIAEAAEIEPGMVVVLGQGGTLYQCWQAYDKRVAGVISGAGDYQPGLILDRRQSQENRMPVALVGKVYCKVDAQYTPIEVGDLLTTSPTPGHAMKADDPHKAFGAVLGKALKPLEGGQGLIPILIALQ